ncbi:MAG: hypothetical protein ABI977_35420, partial [Acidobacteriota bacterium]
KTKFWAELLAVGSADGTSAIRPFDKSVLTSSSQPQIVIVGQLHLPHHSVFIGVKRFFTANRTIVKVIYPHWQVIGQIEHCSEEPGQKPDPDAAGIPHPLVIHLSQRQETHRTQVGVTAPGVWTAENKSLRNWHITSWLVLVAP